MFTIPPVAVGAIVAAVIAALISLIGLIISKEQKTSEFRQAWIDALREDLSTYLTQIRGICDGAAVQYPSLEKKVEALTPLYAELNRATFAIGLRLNPDEPHAQTVLSSMSKLGDLLSDASSLSPAKIQPHESELLTGAKLLLKAEWKRVKRGEPTFIAAKYAALACVLAALFGGWWLVNRSADEASPTVGGREPMPEITASPNPTVAADKSNNETAPSAGRPAQTVVSTQSGQNEKKS